MLTLRLTLLLATPTSTVVPVHACSTRRYTIYPKSFADEAEMSMHDLRHPPGRTYRYYPNPLYAFGTGLSLSTWRVTGTAPSCLATLSTTGKSKGGVHTDGACQVQIKVENTGKYDGDAVIMVRKNARRSASRICLRVLMSHPPFYRISDPRDGAC